MPNSKKLPQRLEIAEKLCQVSAETKSAEYKQTNHQKMPETTDVCLPKLKVAQESDFCLSLESGIWLKIS